MGAVGREDVKMENYKIQFLFSQFDKYLLSAVSGTLSWNSGKWGRGLRISGQKGLKKCVVHFFPLPIIVIIIVVFIFF